MNRVKSFARKPFGSALFGGLIVAVAGWIAIAAGWIDSGGTTTAPAAQTFSAAPVAEPAVAGGKGLTVNDIYKSDSPGVAFIQATQPPQQPSPFNPFGGSGGGTATGSRLVIDHHRPLLPHP